MLTTFDRTVRELCRGRSPLWGSAALTLCALGMSIWAVGAHVPLYITSVEARVVAFGDSIAIESAVEGRVTEVRVEIGDTVDHGDVLVLVDSTALEQSRSRTRRDIELLRELVADTEEEIASVEAIGFASRRASAASVKEALAEKRRELGQQRQASRESTRAARLARQGLIAEQEAERARRLASTGKAAVQVRSQRVRQAAFQARTSALELDARVQRLRRELGEYELEVNRRSMMLDEIEHNLELHTIRAPAAGRIGELRPLAAGTLVSVGTPLGALVPRQDLRVVAHFEPEDGFGWLRVGQPARVRLRGYPSTLFGSLAARVAMVAGETRDGRLRVELELVEPEAFPVDLQHGLPAATQVEQDQEREEVAKRLVADRHPCEETFHGRRPAVHARDLDDPGGRAAKHQEQTPDSRRYEPISSRDDEGVELAPKDPVTRPEESARAGGRPPPFDHMRTDQKVGQIRRHAPIIQAHQAQMR